MHKVSRSLLFAGVLAFGTLTAACGSDTVVTGGGTTSTIVGVTSVLVSPPSASIPVGTTITLSASVSADASTAKTVTWSTSNAAVATVDATGKVTGITAGVVTIIATATADASKSSASAITVTPVTVVIPVPPSIDISAVIQGIGSPGAGLPVNLSNVAGQIDVTVNTSGGGLIELFLSTNCTTNTIASTDVAAASQQATSAQAGQVTLSINTAQLTAANVPRWPNGNFCIKARLTNGTATVVATNTTPLTLNNGNVFKGTVAFATATTGPTSAVSSITGLNYNQGSMTVTLTPVVFTTASPVALISGYFTRNGSVSNAAPGPLPATFTNVAVTSGVATIFFTDTVGSAAPGGNRSIRNYTSLQAGDTLYVTSATDAAGNPIAVNAANQFAVVGGVRIDNTAPNVLLGAGTTWSVVAPNGYIGAAYKFTSGTGGVASQDSSATGVKGVGGVTTTYYVGAAGTAVFSTAGSCSITGLTAAALGTDLANTLNTTTDQAKVVVADALGNQVCSNVFSTQAPAGTILTFGVDKIAPTIIATTASSGVKDQTGYKVNNLNWSFQYVDSGAAGFSATPLRGTMVRNFYGTATALVATATTATAECYIGTFSATTGACASTTVNTTAGTVSNTNGSVTGSFPMATGQAAGTGAANTDAYYTTSISVVDQAGNLSAGPLVQTIALDVTAPTITGLTQSPAAGTPLSTVSVSGAAADNLNLIGSRGNLNYATSPNPFARVTGNTLGTFGQFVTAATATVALPNVYRGMQSTAANLIQNNAVGPTGTITVTDVGTNVTPSAALAITMTGAPVNILTTTSTPATATAITFTINSSAANGVAGAPIATTNLTAAVVGNSNDVTFQSTPFAQMDYYKVSSNNELTLVGSIALAAISDNPTTGLRTYTYTLNGVALNQPSPATSTTFYAIGRDAAGNAVVTAGVTQTNP